MADLAKLVKSFKKLKKTARSDQDVADWFAAHPECIPELPPVLFPYVQVSVSSNGTYNRINADSKLEHRLDLYYYANLPNVPEGMFSREDFATLVGPAAMVENKGDFGGVAGHLVIPMDPKEWRYTVTGAALEVLADGDEGDDHFRIRTRQAWRKVFPKLEWDVLESLYASGLVPEEASAFAEWAMSFKPAQNDATADATLPTDLAL